MLHSYVFPQIPQMFFVVSVLESGLLGCPDMLEWSKDVGLQAPYKCLAKSEPLQRRNNILLIKLAK